MEVDMNDQQENENFCIRSVIKDNNDKAMEEKKDIRSDEKNGSPMDESSRSSSKSTNKSIADEPKRDDSKSPIDDLDKTLEVKRNSNSTDNEIGQFRTSSPIENDDKSDEKQEENTVKSSNSTDNETPGPSLPSPMDTDDKSNEKPDGNMEEEPILSDRDQDSGSRPQWTIKEEVIDKQVDDDAKSIDLTKSSSDSSEENSEESSEESNDEMIKEEDVEDSNRDSNSENSSSSSTSSNSDSNSNSSSDSNSSSSTSATSSSTSSSSTDSSLEKDLAVLDPDKLSSSARINQLDGNDDEEGNKLGQPTSMDQHQPKEPRRIILGPSPSAFPFLSALTAARDDTVTRQEQSSHFVEESQSKTTEEERIVSIPSTPQLPNTPLSAIFKSVTESPSGSEMNSSFQSAASETVKRSRVRSNTSGQNYRGRTLSDVDSSKRVRKRKALVNTKEKINTKTLRNPTFLMTPSNEATVDNLQMTLMKRCIAGFHLCAERYPQHYKSLYRLAYVYHHFKPLEDNEKSREILLGHNQWASLSHMPSPGLFSERKSNNLFAVKIVFLLGISFKSIFYQKCLSGLLEESVS